MTSELSYYDILGVERDANAAAIKTAYRNAAKTSHPDHAGAEHLFRLVQKAYETLSDSTKRERYDKELDGVAATVKPPQPTQSTAAYKPPTAAPTNWGAYSNPKAQHVDQELYKATRARKLETDAVNAAKQQKRDQRRLDWLYILLTGSVAPIAWTILYFLGHVGSITVSRETWPLAPLLSIGMMWWVNKHATWQTLGYIKQGWKRGLVLGCILTLGYSSILAPTVVGACVGLLVVPVATGCGVWSTRRVGAVQWSMKRTRK